MDNKILALQQAGFAALEKAKKLLPKDVDAPPQALRCKYPLFAMLFVVVILLSKHYSFINYISVQVPRCSHHLRFGT